MVIIYICKKAMMKSEQIIEEYHFKLARKAPSREKKGNENVIQML